VRTLDYQYVPNDPYPHQVTVKWYLFGFKLTERVIVASNWEYHSGWYEIPSMKEVHVLHPAIPEIHRMLRQMRYVDGIRA